MHPHLTNYVAQANQQELLRRAEQRGLARYLRGRPSPVARLMSSMPSLSFTRRRPADVPRTAPATTSR